MFKKKILAISLKIKFSSRDKDWSVAESFSLMVFFKRIRSLSSFSYFCKFWIDAEFKSPKKETLGSSRLERNENLLTKLFSSSL